MVLMERDLSLGKNVATRLHAREIDTGRGRWTIQLSNSDADKYCRPRVRALGLSGNGKVLAITIHLGRDADRQVVRLQTDKGEIEWARPVPSDGIVQVTNTYWMPHYSGQRLALDRKGATIFPCPTSWVACACGTPRATKSTRYPGNGTAQGGVRSRPD